MPECHRQGEFEEERPAGSKCTVAEVGRETRRGAASGELCDGIRELDT